MRSRPTMQGGAGGKVATALRSIRAKIFGVAVVLLALMLLASIWSASTTRAVNRQLQTLSEALVPLALSLEDMRTAVAEEYIVLQQQHYERAPPARCRAEFAAQAAIVHRQLDRAQAAHRLGTELAVTERNRVELARIGPMLEQLETSHERYSLLAGRYCDGSVDPAHEYEDAEAAASELRSSIGGLSEEIERFVIETSAIVEANEQDAVRATFVLIGIAGLVGLLLAWSISRDLTRPIARLRDGARAVEQGRLDEEVPVTSKDEIGDVTTAFNAMLGGLRERERIKETFGQYVDPRVVAGLIGGGGGFTGGGERRLATIFFSDIAGFTPIAERLTPSALVNLVNAYFAAMSATIRERSGIIDKYIGDASMAFWVPPFSEASEQAALACAAALDQVERLPAFRETIPDLVGLRRDVPGIDVRIAIASGDAVVGSIGPEFARSFTVMGDTVNFASRLEGANKVYGTRILIDETTRAMAGDRILAREIDTVCVVGKDEPLRLFELVALSGGAADEARDRRFAVYAAGLEAWRAGRWADAEEAFRAAPEDPPARTMLERIAQLDGAPPAGWDGSWRLTGK